MVSVVILEGSGGGSDSEEEGARLCVCGTLRAAAAGGVGGGGQSALSPRAWRTQGPLPAASLPLPALLATTTSCVTSTTRATHGPRHPPPPAPGDYVPQKYAFTVCVRM